MGDTTADRDEEFREYVTARWPRLLRTAYLLCGEQHTAEDLVQSALVRVYVAWRRVRAADEPDAYVRRVLINEHARRHRRKLHQGAEAGPVGLAWLAPTVERVVVHWKDGSTDEPKVVPVGGTDVRWIVSERPAHGMPDHFIDLYDDKGRRTRMGPAVRLEDLERKRPEAVAKEQSVAVTKKGWGTPVKITDLR